MQAALVRLTAGGGFVHDQYIRPREQQEMHLPGCSYSTSLAGDDEAHQQHGRAAETVQALTAAAVPEWQAQAAEFSLGEAYSTLSLADEAAAAWLSCGGRQQSSELALQCVFNYAQQQTYARNFAGVNAALVDYIQLHGPAPEVSWYAAFIANMLGHREEAQRFALPSIELGCFQGSCAKEGRIPNPFARYELPYDVLSAALQSLGDWEGAQQAAAAKHAAGVARKSAESSLSRQQRACWTLNSRVTQEVRPLAVQPARGSSV